MPGVSALAYRILARGGVAAARRRGDAAPIFCFHNVVGDVEIAAHGDPSLHIDAMRFGAILDVIVARYRVIPLTELAHRLRNRQSVQGVACLTFDDTYHGVLVHGVPELKRRELPATLFIVSGAADRPQAYWWDLTASLPAERRDAFLLQFAGDRDRIVGHVPEPSRRVPDELLPADWSSIIAALDGRIIAGSHTVTHRNLSALSADEVASELRESRRRIEERVGTRVETISYPYGFVSRATIEATGRAGYSAAVSLGFGLARSGQHSQSLPRINIPAGLSDDVLECWAAGLRLRQAPIRIAADGIGTAPSGETGGWT